MKRTSSLLLFLAGSLHHITVHGQIATDTIFELHDLQKQPSFPGGEAGLSKYLIEHINLPARQSENNVCCTFAFRFIISRAGSIENVTILKGNPEVAKEMVDALEVMPCWEPGVRGDKYVNVRFVLPVRFHPE